MRRAWGRMAAGMLVLAAGTHAADAQVTVKVSDDVFFRLGLQLQGTMDWQQDPISEGYSQNMFLRRIRFAVAGQVAKDVSVFFQTDAPRLGNAGAGTSTPTKNLATGFIVQDAFGEWRIAGDALMLDAGLFYVPQSRNVLTSTSSNLTIDSGNFLQQQNTLTQSSTGRDVGLGLKGYVAGDHLEYRAAVFDGLRVPATPSGAGSRNAYRFAGRVQWDFLNTEKGYVYVGVQRGAKKIVELGAWADAQGDYLGWGADAALDLPVGTFGSVNAEVDYAAFDGGTEFTSVVGGVVTPLLPKQDSITAQAGFWHAATNLQPFVRYETLNLSDPVFAAREQKNWYIVGNNLKLSGLYERIDPKAAAAGSKIKNTDHYLLQIQFYYF